MAFSEKVARLLVKKSVISADDIKLYQFGLQGLIMKCIHIITYLIIGLAFQELVQVVLFTAAYVLPRKYAGGYHAKTPLRCYFLSCLMIIAAMLLIKFIPVSIQFYSTIGLLALSGSVIFFLSPVESLNKPLEAIEITCYGKRARLILLMEIGAAGILLYYSIICYAFTIGLGLFALAVMLVAGKVQIDLLKEN